MEIIRGKILCAKKVVIYGSEGIGKSTFASKFPDAVFIDTEGSTKELDVARLKMPTSWSMLLNQVRDVISNPDICKTLIIDTADWAEHMCVADICARYMKSSIEEFGYGKGYTYLKEEFGRLLNLLTELVEEKGVNVVLTAHAQMRKFEQPDEMGSYDRWEMKLSKQVSPLVKEWGDMVLFANYKTQVVKVDGKNKAQGGRRVLYTTHHSCWDAKNRYGLPEEVPFEYSSIAHIIPANGVTEKPRYQEPQVEMPNTATKEEPVSAKSSKNSKKEEKREVSLGVAVEKNEGQVNLPLEQNHPPVNETVLEEVFEEPDPLIPKSLRDLMIMHRVDEWDIQNVVAARGYFPSDMLIRDYPEDFITGVLVGAWNQVHHMIKEAREKMEIPFN